MVMSGQSVTTINSMTTSLDIFSEVGAFTSALFFLIGLLCLSYNKWAFYSEHPAWAAVNSKFEVDPDAPSMVEAREREREAAERKAGGETQPEQPAQLGRYAR